MISESISFLKVLCIAIFVVGLFNSDITEASSELRQNETTSRGKRSTGSSTDDSYFYYQRAKYPRDCKEVCDQCEGQCADGVYLIKPDSSPEAFVVYCNNSIDNGGWTVFQRRLDGSVEFYRSWNEYKDGFGFLRREFWLGNDKISQLTNQKHYELRIDLNNVNGQPYFAKYNLFRISDEGSKYRLVGLGDYHWTSTAINDALNYHRNQSFSTRDRDNDHHNCATFTHGAWWFNGAGNCMDSHLNALYNAGSSTSKNLYWHNLPGDDYHIKYTEMKIRPLPDT